MRPSATRFLFAGPFLAALLLPALAHAKRAPGSTPNAAVRAIPRLDLAIDPTQAARREGPARVQYGTTGVLRRYWLREPAGSVVVRPAALVAREFIEGHASELGLDAATIDRALSAPVEKPGLSGTHLRWEQQVGGVPVWQSDLVVKVASGAVSSVQNNLHPGIALSTQPAIDGTAAMNTAIEAIGPIGRAIGEFSSRLFVVPMAAGPRLAWVVTLPLEQPAGDWRVFVDARTGAVAAIEDAMQYVNGTGRVFDPDPMTKMADSSFVDNADANTSVPFPAAYDIVTLNDLTLSAGVYLLSGPYAKLIDNESPTVAPVTATQPDSFRYQRSPSGFEDVMTYYQIDRSERYIQSLGFLNVNNRVQQIDSHGLSGADNSHYVPSTKNLAFGEGGIDDAEDADVVWHEFGHSIQDDIVPGWGGGQEGAMGEGFGDYWAGSYSLSISPAFQPGRVFTWDGNGETWNGRKLIDVSLHYPENANGEVHDSGTLWCSALMDCWWRLGRGVMDRLVIDHHFALGTTATMADAAQQVIQSDIDLYGGAHVQTLVDRFGFWGMVDPSQFLPTITHTPLTDTENTTGPYVVTAVITAGQPLDASSLKVYWGVGAFTDSLLMTPTGNPNEYAAAIPGPQNGVDVRYYIRARDTGGGVATHPAGAPASFHQFHAGADVTPPVIVHTPIGSTPSLQWPKTVLATVTDNLGVNPDSVRVDWTRNGSARQTFYLARVGATSDWSASFPGVNADVAPGDVIAYHLTARDQAATPNVARSPAAGEHSFAITASPGTVLVLDDDELAKQGAPKVVVDEKTGEPVTITAAQPLPNEIASANVIAGILGGLGYTVTVESAATSNPATWPSYSFLVSASGANTSPVANSAYRTALESHVAAGRKLLVEGGEVGFDAISSPGYATFAANVLHGNTWATDNAGSLQRLAAQATHPIATIPNALPATLPISYSGFGSEDSYKPTAPAYAVYGVTTQTGNAGILVYDPTPPPQSGQVVVLAFNLKEMGDATLRTQLVQNVAAYLTASEPPADCAVKGSVVIMGAPDRSGVQVTATPGTASTSTDVSGWFSLTGLYSGATSLTFSKAGYRTEIRNVNLAAGQTLSGLSVRLYPIPTAQACASPALAIPDNNATGVQTSQNVAAAFTVSSVTVDLNLTHTFVGDLIVELRHGAKTVRLRNRTGGSADNIVGNFPGTLVVDGPGSLASTFSGDPSNGTWTLFVSDNASQDVGTINSWCVNLVGQADTLSTTAVGDVGPEVAALLPAVPNPVTGAGTTLRFALPQRAAVTLALYDVSGRLVKTLAEGVRDAGEHTIRWDGRANDGRRAAAGVYLARFRTGGYETTRRISLLR